jgi:hypothetical protein
MQDRYAGDVGDFGKLGLLRWLCGVYPPAKPRLRLGIAWYLVPDETVTNDGKHVSYLRSDISRNERFRCCDPELYDRLAEMVSIKRSIEGLQASGVLPPSTVHFRRALSYQDLPGRRDRELRRQAWIAAAADETRDCDLIFIDPDNGLETPSIGRFRARGPKYAYFDDLEPLITRGQSLVIYQHVHRSGKVADQARRRIEQLHERFNVTSIWAVQYRRGSGRLYIIVPAAAHERILKDRASSLLSSLWHEHGHFQSIPSL